MIIDSHCHLHDEKFSSDLNEILNTARQAGITHFIDIGCDLTTSQNAFKISNMHEDVFFSAGFHPHEAKFCTEKSLEDLKNLAHEKKCVAIGECGLDYFYNHSDKESQQKAFIAQIELAYNLKLPLIIHLRDAYDDCISILNNYKKNEQKFVIHCFSGTLKQAQKFIDMNAYISLSGIITFKNPQELIFVAQSIPLTNLIIETDAPYLAPHPFRGKRNEPSFITQTLDKIISVRSENKEEIIKQIYKNTLKLFNLKN